VNVGGTVRFKIDTDASAYSVDIYRLGFYGGAGARKVASVVPSVVLPQVQPACLTDASVLLTDCGNWGVSASWVVPVDAVSGVYIAVPRRADTGGMSHIPFVVRDDASRSAVVFQTSDPTWQAYNRYGGANFYSGARAMKVSYNRPITTRSDVPWGRDFLFANEYPMIRFLERNGYDVSYIAGVDTDRSGSLLLNHKTFVSVGHDEYWSGAQRANVAAARDAGVNLAFFSGNDVYWRTRYEPSIDGSGTSYRTLVCYKETWSNAKVDPSGEWTGTWRDPRFTSAPNGGFPENALIGTQYMVNDVDLPLSVTAADGKLRVWRNTSVASLAAGTSASVGASLVGYESNEDVDNGFRPAGLFRMSTTTGPTPQYLQDYGSVAVAGTTTHSITMYKAASGARVFSAGTVQWSWGLDSDHDYPGAGPVAVSPQVQQATINVLADMDAQPTTLMAGMVAASKTTDTTAPTVVVSAPAVNATVANGAAVTVSGTASDAGGRVGGVEVSLNGGRTWHPASGRESWTYTGQVEGAGASSVRVRAVDDSANLGAAVVVPVTVTCPCTLFGSGDPAASGGKASGDPTPVEVGTRFTAQVDGVVLGVRFHKGTGNGGTHVGSLWSASGQLLARATFTAETASGWQEVRFSAPVPVAAGTTYVVSYYAPTGNYTARGDSFNTAVQVDPLTAPASTATAPNGVYALSNTFPTSTFKATNYYVDVVFQNGDPVPPAVTTTQPLAGSSSADPAAAVQVGFNERLTTTGLTATITPAGTTTPVASTATITTTGTGVTATSTVSITPTTALAPDTVHTVSVRAADLAGNQMSVPFTFTFRTGRALTTPGICPCGFFQDRAPTDAQTSNDRVPVELGIRFAPTETGLIRGIQFFKAPTDTGPHTVTLWTETGTQLAQSTPTSETTSGWQEAIFPTPVPVTPGTTYIAAYRTTTGAYTATPNGFGPTGITTGPLFTPTTGGVYTYSPTTLPTTRTTTNYWVDIVFDRGAVGLVSRVPAAGATTVDPAAPITATFDRVIDTAAAKSATLTAGTTPVPATVTWRADNGSGRGDVTITPTSRLADSTVYTVTVSARDLSGNSPAAPLTWTFTTAAAAPASGCPCGLFDDVTPSGYTPVNDGVPLELGVRFSPTRDGSVTGIQFLKPPGMTGTHTVSLWDAGGTRLATGTATNESASGWQTVPLTTPVTVTAGAVYTASFTSPTGQYAFQSGGLSTAISRPPLSTPALAGAFTYTQGAFPTNSATTNYWVDVVIDGTVPGVPGAVTATPGDSSVSVSWTAPAQVGGPVTSYTATVSPGGASCTAVVPAVSCVVGGLTNGVSYSVSVTATNAAGTGPAGSGAVAVVPYPASVMSAAATSLWLDGADASRLVASSSCTGAVAAVGGSVGCWLDKSAKANNAVQATVSAQALRSSLNGQVAPLFDGVADAYSLDATKLPTGTTASAVYVVATQEDALPTFSCWRHAFAYGAAATGAARSVAKGCNNSNAYVDTYNTWSSMAVTRTWPVNTATLVDGTVTSTAVTSNVNGAVNYVFSGAANTGTSAGARVGTSPWGGGFWKGRIAEVIVLSGTPTAAQNRAVQEYLARKWGLAITSTAPQSVAAAPSKASTVVTWAAPAYNGGSAVTSYRATAAPGGASCTATAPATTCTITGLTNGTAYTVTVTATNGAGSSAGATATVTPTALPAPWVAASSVPATIGATNGTFSLASAGADIWLTADQYAAAYTPASARAGTSVTARVASQTNTDPWAKAGVVLRNSVPGAGTSPGYAVMVLTPGNGVAFQWDSDGNGTLDSFTNTAVGTPAPVWVRLTRVGSTQVAGYYSTNGTTWTQVGATVTLPGIAATQDAGIIMTSHNASVVGTATFTNLLIG
jgi:hypothetical protein